ncbi:MAG: hypothetical protein RL758_1556 [Pseudomonadota bacterium]|jgi:Domain of unknown function (DUF4124)
MQLATSRLEGKRFSVYNRTMRSTFTPFTVKQASFGLLFLLLAGACHAQWQWLDPQGKHVFSDMPPPTSIPEKNILRRPVEGFVPTAESPTTAKPTSGQSELGKKVGEAKAAEDAKAQALKEKEAEVLAENCNRARRSKAGLDSGQRLSVTDDKGEQGFMSDQARAAELQRVNDFIEQNCR